MFLFHLRMKITKWLFYYARYTTWRLFGRLSSPSRKKVVGATSSEDSLVPAALTWVKDRRWSDLRRCFFVVLSEDIEASSVARCDGWSSWLGRKGGGGFGRRQFPAGGPVNIRVSSCRKIRHPFAIHWMAAATRHYGVGGYGNSAVDVR